MTTTSENKNTVTSWRVRDAADNLLARRGLRSTSLFESSSSPPPGITATTTNNNEVTCHMTLSKYFLEGLVTYSETDPTSSNTVQECQARLRGDKTSVVHMAFNAAANAVLENLHKADDDDDDDDDNDDNGEELQEKQQKRQRLPSIFEDIIKLQEIRTASMDRAHANKDLSKRKIAVAKEQEEERRQKPKLPPPLVVKEPQRQPQPKLTSKSKPVGDIGEKKKLNNPIPTISPPENIKSAAAVAAVATVVVASSSSSAKSNPTDDQKQQDLAIKQPKEEEIPIKQEQHNKEPILADPDLVSSSSVTTTATTTSSSSVGPAAVKDDTTKNLIQTTATDSKSNENDVIPQKVASSTTIDTTTSTSSSSNTVKLPSLTSASSSSSGVNSNSSSTTPTKTPTAAPKFKFTRNTPASSTSALEARLTGSRAVLCTTANVAFDSLTPPLPELDILEVADIPQNPKFRSSNNNQLLTNGDNVSVENGNDGNDAVNKVEHVTVMTEKSNNSNIEQDGGDKTTSFSAVVPNMGAVIIEAKALGQRIETIAANAVKRSQRRFRFRKDSIVFHNKSLLCNDLSNTNDDSGFRILENPFAWKDEKQEHEKNGGKVLTDDDDGANDGDSMGVSAMEVDDSLSVVTAENIPLENSESWEKSCIPRLLSILKTGVGNGIIYDAMWSTRHGRIANLFQEISCNEENYGLHLIVTIDPDVDRFTKEFKTINSHLRLMSTVDEKSLRAMPYKGNAEQRRRLRKKFTQATGLSDAPFHVIVTSYTNFLKDYIHFCQTPFEVVLMDDGASIMAAAHNDPNSAIHTIWEEALFSKSDHQMGLAGSFLRDWDYEEDEFDEDTLKDVWIGLTARHRLITSSKLLIQNPKTPTQDMLPVSGLLNFVVPHFAEAVREEWDRSRIGNDDASMRHFQKLLTRSLVVHAPKVDDQSVFKLAMKTLQGDMEDPIRSKDPKIPKIIADEKFIIDGKVASSRRSALHWLGPVEDSWLRYELGSANFGPIITAMKASLNYGHICEEIVTASSVTTGATGQIFGNVAYKLAVRCGRSFGSEQGLRQHLSTHHAPPGTWLCRTCKADCVTSQARTHHERSCGQPSAGSWSATDVPVAASDGVYKRGVGKKKVKTSKGDAVSKEEKDADGSIRVPSYRGVWVDQIGKFFVKIKADRVCGEGGGTLKFEKIDVAATKYDDLLYKKGKDIKDEFNFKSDGTRIIYEDVSTSSTASLGGGSASVIPALSVININDLPKDVKPLLRDPRQTSRTGGNSKRHVYAYRGVCRQARKGLDRWQSQISFLGVNHYLGTFDSEWDAAAIYGENTNLFLFNFN